VAAPIKVLFVEDSKNDCDLLLEHLREHGYEASFERVEAEPEMMSALDKTEFDIILCDHNLPNFNVSKALTLSKRKVPHIPFIVVSGSVSEEVAVETLKAGAKDYVIKNNLSRLIPAIERELIEAKSHAVHLRVEAELQKKELELRQAQKLEAVGQLAGGVAHDFNNILAVILMQAEGSLESIDENPELKKKVNGQIYKSLEQIKKAGHRAANLTRQLLAFSRKQVIQPKVLDVNEMVRDMEKMLSRVIEENIKLELDLNKDSKNIKVDPGHFEQIIMNLVVNSRDAMPSGGKLKIKTENSFINEEIAQKTNTKPGAYTLLQVIDTGSGMSEEIQKHMFDPFFTTKGIGKGTGLGLSTVYGIVKQNKGLIFVESTPHVGTTFKIYFPQSEEGAQVSVVVTPKMKDLRGTETILVAEDDVDLRELVCETLKSSGYTVLEARDGVEAIEQIKSYTNPIHLVLTDVVMPNMGGRELSERARSLNADTKFLFLSGYTEDVLLQQGINSGQTYFLEKPFAMKVLLNKVRIILESEQ
jgi:two-component system cell cycle sensor histidine kinase/response regulator CckA